MSSKDDEPEVDFEVVSTSGTSAQPPTPPVSTGKKMGRPRKYHKYKMLNGSITAERIFLYVPHVSLPAGTIDRFLELSDRLLIELGPKVVSETDVKDVATLFRDTIVRDGMYESMAECEGVADKTTMNDLKKMSDQIDMIQKSLKVRAADREQERRNNKDLTMVDIIDKFIDDENLFSIFEVQQRSLIEKYYDNPHMDVDDYMSIHTVGSSEEVLQEGEED